MQFVSFLWRGHGFNKSVAVYDERHYYALYNSLWLHGQHSLLCVQDGSFDIPGSIIMPEEIAALPNYLPKLWAWSKDFYSRIERAFTFIDLDAYVLSDISNVIDTSLDFHIWNEARLEAYNSSLFHLGDFCYSDVWDTLTPERLADAKSKARKWTGDQSWIEYVLGPSMPTFGEEAGIIRYRPRQHKKALPKDTKAVFLCGPYDPITESKNLPWINQNYQTANV